MDQANIFHISMTLFTQDTPFGKVGFNLSGSGKLGINLDIPSRHEEDFGGRENEVKRHVNAVALAYLVLRTQASRLRTSEDCPVFSIMGKAAKSIYDSNRKPKVPDANGIIPNIPFRAGMKNILEYKKNTAVWVNPEISIIVYDGDSESRRLQMSDPDRLEDLAEELKHSTESPIDVGQMIPIRHIGLTSVVAYSGGPRAKPLNQLTIRDESDIRIRREKFFHDYPDVVSSPGTVFFGGEKTGVDCGQATMMHIPRRVYVGVHRIPNERGIVIDKSWVLDPQHTDRCGVDNHLATVALMPSIVFDVLLHGLENLLGKQSDGLRLRIWSEWEGESGLGWSAAFAAATAGAILQACEHSWLNEPDPDTWGDPMLDCFALAWLFESAIHNGRAQGASVAASIASTALPLCFQCGTNPETEATPRLWKLSKPDKDSVIYDDLMKSYLVDDDPETPHRDELVSQMERVVDRFIKYVTEGKSWKVEILPEPNLNQEKQTQLWRSILLSGNILVVGTGTCGSTAATSARQLSSELLVLTQADASSCMNLCYRFIADAMRSMIRSDSHHENNNCQWKIIIESMSRARGFLLGQGFEFALGDALLKQMNRTESDYRSDYIGGKTSGKGTAGNLIVAHLADEKLRTQLHQCVSSFDVPGRCSVLYDTRLDIVDTKEGIASGLEYEGLRMEKIKSVWKG